MARLLLLSPPLSLEKRYGRLAAAGNTLPALGLLSLAAVARRAGHKVRLLDATAMGLPPDATLGAIQDYAPQMLGISSTTLGVAEAGALAAAYKNLDANCMVVLGGPHASAVPEETLRAYPSFDAACIGEGEETLAELLEALDSAESPSGQGGGWHGALRNLSGMAYLEGDVFQQSSQRAPLQNLDQLPFPAWDLLPGFPHRYQPAANRARLYPAASLVSTRGCPNQCTFCDRSVFGAHCRGFSSGYFLEMVRELQTRWGVRELLLEDDTFFVLRRRLVEICEGLARSRKPLSWSCLGRARSITPEILRLMKRAGCWQIAYGIESGSQDILDLEKKHQTLEEVERAVRWTSEAGILAKGFFILGHPGETEQTLRATHSFALRLRLHDISVFFMTPFPGSQLYKEADQYGELQGDWQKMNLLNIVFVPKGLTPGTLVLEMRRLVRDFYLRPRIVWSLFRRCLRHPKLVLQMVRSAIGLLRFLRN